MKPLKALRVMTIGTDGKVEHFILCHACGWQSRSDTSRQRTFITMRNLKKCPECGAEHVAEK